MTKTKRRMLGLLVVGTAALWIGSAGCARRVVHHHRHDADVVVLDREHHDVTILVVDKPHPKRRCWKHRKHWHCRVR